MAKERISWIDALKALGIFLIVLGHALHGNSKLWHLVYGFHVPMFFYLTGRVFRVKKENNSFFHFLKIKFYKILLPYYFWGLVSIIVYLFFGSKFDGADVVKLPECFFGLIWANGENGFMRWNLPLWFLPVLFIVELLGYIQEKLINHPKFFFVSI